jgi:hypothetical protein
MRLVNRIFTQQYELERFLQVCYKKSNKYLVRGTEGILRHPLGTHWKLRNRDELKPWQRRYAAHHLMNSTNPMYAVKERPRYFLIRIAIPDFDEALLYNASLRFLLVERNSTVAGGPDRYTAAEFVHVTMHYA